MDGCWHIFVFLMIFNFDNKTPVNIIKMLMYGHVGTCLYGDSNIAAHLWNLKAGSVLNGHLMAVRNSPFF